MHAAKRNQDDPTERSARSTEEGPALRDAADILAREERKPGRLLGRLIDEAEAQAARERFQVEPLPVIEPDEQIGPHLAAGEMVHDMRSGATTKPPGGQDALGYGGTLYLTSRRLVHMGQVFLTVMLADIVETSLAGDRLLLSLRDGEGLTLDVEGPRLLRAHIAAAMQELRG